VEGVYLVVSHLTLFQEKEMIVKIKADDLRNPSHPLRKAFLAFCNGKVPTKRQARKFLQKFPQYRVGEKV
jgi:hypothetical protein